MKVTPVIQSMIREGKVHQLDNAIYAGADAGMRNDILCLYKEGRITKDTTLVYAVKPEMLSKGL